MADNIRLPSSDAAGETIAADEIGGIFIPRSKIVIGADGTNDGDVSSNNPLPVTGTVTANLGATDNAVLDAIAASLSGTLTVGSHAVTNAGTFVVQINGDALTALQLLDDAVAAEGSALGKGVLLQGDDGTDRTNVLVDTDGHLQVDVLSSSTVTVTGTVTAELGAIDSASLAAIEAAVEGTLTVGLPSGASTAANQTTIIGHLDGVETLLTTIDGDTGTLAGTVDGSEVQVDIVASLPAGTNNIGDVDVLTFPSTVHSSDFDTGAGTDTTLSMGIAVPANGGAAVITGDATNGLDVDVTRVGGNVTVVNAGTFAVQAAQSGTWNITNVTGTVSLPTGAATAAKQPALGTAGSASSDVITVQGVASMTPILVNGSGVTQPISGTVTAELSATDNAVLDAIAASVAGTLTVGSHEVTNAGTFAVQVDGTALAAIQVIEDAVGEEGGALNKGVLLQGDDGTDRTNVLVDTDGHLQVDVITGGDGGTQYDVDDALGANPTGTLAIAIRDDALSALTPAEGDAVGVRVNANGALWVIPSGTTAVSGTVDLGATDNAVLDAIAASTAAIETAVEGTLTVGSHAVTNAGTFAVQAAQSGTWTVDLGATDNAVLDAIASSLSGTLTVGSHHVTNAGTFTVQVNGDALTALQLLDNVVYVDDADWTATTSSHALVGGVYQSTPGTITDGDTGPIRLTANGAVHAAIQNTVTVSGTVDLGATDNAVLDAIAASTAAIETAVEGTLTVASHAVTNAGTFAVQSTLQAGTAYAGKVRLTDGTTDTDIRDLANSNALNVAIVDSSGDQITSFGGGTQYAVDDALGANPTGTLTVAIRDDALSALTPAEGDAVGVRVDANGALWVIPSGTVTVSGTVTANLSATDNAVLDAIQAAVETIDNAISGTEMQVDVLTSALPTGASTAANQTTIIGHLDGVETLLGTIDADTGTIAGAFGVNGGVLGKGVVIQGNDGTDRSDVKVDGSGRVHVNVDSSVIPTGAATSAKQDTVIGHLDGVEGLLTTIDADTGGMLTSLQLLDNAISGNELQVDVVGALPAGTNTIGVVINERVSTATLSNVSGSASSVQLLASTAGRKGASFHNDSTAVAYVKFGTTASTTSFTVKMNPDAHYELPQPVFTGRIDCIWAAANGAMRITEYT